MVTGGIVAAIGIVALLLAFFPPVPTIPGSYQKRISFMEIQPAGTADQQFIELYTWDTIGHDLGGWTVSNSTAEITLPSFQELGNLTYIVIRFSAGASDLNALDKVATYHVTREGFLGTGGELVLYDHLNRVVDHVVYGGATPSMPAGQWATGDTGAVHSGDPTRSLQMWGPDQDNSSNWVEDEITPGTASVCTFDTATVNGTIPVAISNGINFALPQSTTDGYRFTQIVVRGNPAGWATRADVAEMANFTLQHYASLGFPAPKLVGGKVRIYLSNSSRNYTTGSCDRDGRVTVNVGQVGGMAGKVGLKYTVEHELMHAIQASGGPGYDHWGKPADDPLQEGMAVWGGLSSTMKNYNLTWNDTMAYLRMSGAMNWFDHYRNTNTTLWPWPTSGWTRYMGMGMFIKFVNETLGGNATLVGILRGVKTHTNGSVALDTNATQALEAATGLSFEELWRRFQAWLADGSASKANGWPRPGAHSSPQVPNTPSTTTTDGPVTVAPYGSDVEFVNCAGKTNRFTLNFGNLDGNTKWKITIIYTRPDGTTSTSWFTIAGSVAPVPVDPTQWANITIVKTRIGDAGTGRISLNVTTVAGTSVPGRDRTDPHHSGVCAAAPVETRMVSVANAEMSEHVLVWLDEGWTLTVAMNTSLDPLDDRMQFEVLSLSNAAYPPLPLNPPLLPNGNPKISQVQVPFAQYVLVRVFWGMLPFPVGPGVDATLELFVVA